MVIGTDAPSPEQLSMAEHFMIGTLNLTDYYSAAAFESDVMALLNRLFESHSVVILCGGSMMYIDAVCKGIDEMPTIPQDIRQDVVRMYEEKGLDALLEELAVSDPEHYDAVDKKNYKRVIHALEICRASGATYSSLRKQTAKERPFSMLKVGLIRERAELYNRINMRVDSMMGNGFVEEAISLYPFRRLNSLNTVGYKELFAYIDGEMTLDTAVDKIKRNTRIYARKQITWFKRDKEVLWFHPTKDKESILDIVRQRLAMRT
jgi:tRNA dimethylallyltransferase